MCHTLLYVKDSFCSSACFDCSRFKSGFYHSLKDFLSKVVLALDVDLKVKSSIPW